MNFEKLERALDRLIGEWNTPGVDCIVCCENKQIFRYCNGKRDNERNIDIDGTELYPIFSMTKMITCVAALQLFEKGCYSMNDPLSKYIKEFEKMKLTGGGYAKNPITIKHLFTMSAGLNYNLYADGIKRARSEGRISTREIVKALSETELSFEPGTFFEYSLCHDVLGAVIEIWSGMSLGEYMKKNIFEPLGMKDTFFRLPKDTERLSRIPQMYTYQEDGSLKISPLECPYNLSDEYESGGAGLVSSAEDYALFLDAVANGGRGRSGNQILNPSSIELMRTNHLNEKQLSYFSGELRKGYGYGLGVRTHLFPEKSGSKSPVGEFGWDGAAGAFALVDPERKLSLTYFQQALLWDIEIQGVLKNALYESLEG